MSDDDPPPLVVDAARNPIRPGIVPDGGRVTRSMLLMDYSQQGVTPLSTFLIDGQSMTADAAVSHLKGRIQGLEGQLAALTELHYPSQPVVDAVRDNATRAALAFRDNLNAQNRRKYAEPTTPRDHYVRRLQNAWQG